MIIKHNVQLQPYNSFRTKALTKIFANPARQMSHRGYKNPSRQEKTGTWIRVQSFSQRFRWAGYQTRNGENLGTLGRRTARGDRG